jgi:hypothetical protein
MHDADVRLALHERLRGTHRLELESTRFVDELGIAGQVRVDIAVLNGAFSGYEIKSDRDNLLRLPTQVEVYSKVLDYCTLVVADRHLEHSLELLPSWWGVLRARSASGAVMLTKTRSPRLNPRIDRRTLASLLWRSEALDALGQIGADRGIRSRPNAVLWDRLAESMSTRTLRKKVRETLKVRVEWR